MKVSRLSLNVSWLLLAIAVTSVASSRPVIQLLPETPIRNGFFGASLGLDDGLLVVSEPLSGEHGAAYVFDAASGTRLHTLISTQNLTSTSNIEVVAIDDGLIALGSPATGTRAGSVHLFDAVTGEETGHLMFDPAMSGSYFGISLDVDQGLVIAGAPKTDGRTASFEAGAAYVFDASGRQVSRLGPEDPRWPGGFGRSVAIENGIALVGEGTFPYINSKAYLFDAMTGEELFELIPDGGLPIGHDYGISVALDDGIAFVAGGGQQRSADPWTVYAFDTETGREVARFNSDEPRSSSQVLGRESVSASNGVLAVGPRSGDFSGGILEVFDVDSESRFARLDPLNQPASRAFGVSTVTDGRYVAVGDYLNSTAGTRAGAVF